MTKLVTGTLGLTQFLITINLLECRHLRGVVQQALLAVRESWGFGRGRGLGARGADARDPSLARGAAALCPSKGQERGTGSVARKSGKSTPSGLDSVAAGPLRADTTEGRPEKRFAAPRRRRGAAHFSRLE